MDEDQLLEDAMFPWLASGSMSDECNEDYPPDLDYGYEDEEYDYGGEG